MNILLINHYAGSVRHGMEFRPYYLAREWVADGHYVRIVAANESHLRAVRPVVTGRQEIQNVDGIEYQWLKTPAYHGNGAMRALNIFAFASAAYYGAKEFVAAVQPNVVIASSTHPFDIYAAHRIARMAGARLVFEVHDLWPLTPIELAGMSPLHPFILAVSEAEKFAYRHADKVVSMLPAARDYMVSRGMASEKFVHIPNGISVAEWSNASRPAPENHIARMAVLRDSGKFLIGYAGGHGLANALDNLLDAAIRLRDDKDVHFVLVGQGPDKDRLKDSVLRRDLANVTFLDPVSKECIPDILSKFDALFLGWQKKPIYRFGISPNKLMDYMVSGKPVIHAVAAANDPVAEAGCGLSVAPEDPKALAEAILRLKQASEASLAEMGRRGREFVISHHGYRVLSANFLAGVMKT
jgi:glycosyltransferase involved in cell wall biosynthesis